MVSGRIQENSTALQNKKARNNVVLVTGAGGFIGSAVVRQLVNAYQRNERYPLLSDGQVVESVVAVVRPGGSTRRLETLKPSDFWSIAYADLLDQTSLLSILNVTKPRTIIHLGMDSAAYGALTEDQQIHIIDIPLKSLFLALEDVPDARIVTTGSAAVLKPGDKLAENTPIEPNPAYLDYAINKIREEELLLEYGEMTGVPWIHLRLFYTFGKYESMTRLLPHIVSHLIRQEQVQLSCGTHIRDFTDVDDVAFAYLLAIGARKQDCSMTYHIGTGEGISIREFAQAVTDVVGYPELLKFGTLDSVDQHQPCIVADTSLAHRNLGWSPPTNTAEKIRHVAKWWTQQINRQI